jgi:hypothetical protein
MLPDDFAQGLHSKSPVDDFAVSYPVDYNGGLGRDVDRSNLALEKSSNSRAAASFDVGFFAAA